MDRTEEMRRLMPRLEALMASPNRDRNIAQAPAGLVEDWGHWADLVLTWAGTLRDHQPE